MEQKYAEYAAQKAVELLAIDSPTGFTDRAAAWVQDAFGALGFAAKKTAKGGVLALTRYLAYELGKYNIRVNAICPGVIQTDMCANVAPEILESLREQTPIERLGTPEDIAQAMAFLVDAPFITGQVLGVNGGFVIT